MGHYRLRASVGAGKVRPPGAIEKFVSTLHPVEGGMQA
jgi:hypothetical protein